MATTTLALSLPLVDAEILHLTSSSLSGRPSPSTSAALLAAHPLMAVRRMRRMKPPSALGASLSGALHSASRSSYSTDGNRPPIHRRLSWNGRLKLKNKQQCKVRCNDLSSRYRPGREVGPVQERIRFVAACLREDD